MPNPNQSPFAALSFSEQQEQWRIFRAQHLDFQQVAEQEDFAAPALHLPRAGHNPPLYEAPRHSNLDRVRAQLTAASRRAGAFQPVTPADAAGTGSAPRW